MDDFSRKYFAECFKACVVLAIASFDNSFPGHPIRFMAVMFVYFMAVGISLKLQQR